MHYRSDLSGILFCFWVVSRTASWHFKKETDICTRVTRSQTPTCAKTAWQVPQTVTLDWSAFEECWPHPGSASCRNYSFNLHLWTSCCCVSHVDRHVGDTPEDTDMHVNGYLLNILFLREARNESDNNTLNLQPFYAYVGHLYPPWPHFSTFHGK